MSCRLSNRSRKRVSRAARRRFSGSPIVNEIRESSGGQAGISPDMIHTPVLDFCFSASANPERAADAARNRQSATRRSAHPPQPRTHQNVRNARPVRPTTRPSLGASCQSKYQTSSCTARQAL